MATADASLSTTAKAWAIAAAVATAGVLAVGFLLGIPRRVLVADGSEVALSRAERRLRAAGFVPANPKGANE